MFAAIALGPEKPTPQAAKTATMSWQSRTNI
jgi:hypothetical protein